MEIQRNGIIASVAGPSNYFSGKVRLDSLFQNNESRKISGLNVTFEAGSRTFWHTHPLGQTLIITSGIALVQRWGGNIEKANPGDVVWFSPNEKHWHGATSSVAMTHIAIQEHLNGKAVDWLEEVTNQQYKSGLA